MPEITRPLPPLEPTVAQTHIAETVPLFENAVYRPLAAIGFGSTIEDALNAAVDFTLRLTDRAPARQTSTLIGEIIALRAGIMGAVLKVTVGSKAVVLPGCLAFLTLFSPEQMLHAIDGLHHALAALGHHLPGMVYGPIDRSMDWLAVKIRDLGPGQPALKTFEDYGTFLLALIWAGRGPRRVEWLERCLRIRGFEIVQDGDFVAIRSLAEPVGRIMRLHRRAQPHPAIRRAQALRFKAKAFIGRFTPGWI